MRLQDGKSTVTYGLYRRVQYGLVSACGAGIKEIAEVYVF